MNFNRRHSSNNFQDMCNEEEQLLFQDNLQYEKTNSYIPVKLKACSYFLFFIMSTSNIIISIFVLMYIQEINNKASLLTNTTLLNSIDKIETIIDYVCKQVIKQC